MNRSDEQGVKLILLGFFRAGERQLREQCEKVLRIAQILSKQGLQRGLVVQLYSIFQKLLKRDNFATLCKRLLLIWDELLQGQVRRGSSTGFRTAISDIIVESYTFIFPLILEYRFHDLILDFKLYRMLWAKYISDESFFQIRTEIAKLFRNFDLNKGLEMHFEKIRERFARKGATEEEIQKYMGITQLERKTDPSPSAERRERRERPSSDDEVSEARRKQVKQDGVPQHFARQNYDGYSPEQYMYPGPAANYPQQQQAQYQVPLAASGYPARSTAPQQSGYAPPPASTSLYPGYPRPYSGSFNPPPPPQQQPAQHSLQQTHYQIPGAVAPAQNYYPEPKPHYGAYQDYGAKYPPSYSSQPAYSAPTTAYIPPTQSFPAQSSAFPNYPNASQRQKMQQAEFPMNPREMKRQSPEFTPKMGRSPLQYYPDAYETAPTKGDFRAASEVGPLHSERPDKSRYKALLGNLKRGLSECKECGVHFLSRENLDEHRREHFQEAQRRFQAKQSEQIGASLGLQRQRLRARENFDMLCTAGEWVLGGSAGEADAVYQVSIKRLPPMERTTPVFYCYFCNEGLEINWCPQLQEWTLNNGVKVHEEDHGLSVAHFDCYECFRNDAAPNAAQLVN